MNALAANRRLGLTTDLDLEDFQVNCDFLMFFCEKEEFYKILILLMAYQTKP